MEDLREKTHYLHYELYRKKRLEEMGFEDNTGYVCVCVRACVCVCVFMYVYILNHLNWGILIMIVNCCNIFFWELIVTITKSWCVLVVLGMLAPPPLFLFIVPFSLSFPLSLLSCSLSEAYEQKRKEHFKEMQAKEEHMRQMFVQKVCYGYHGNAWFGAESVGLAVTLFSRWTIYNVAIPACVGQRERGGA